MRKNVPYANELRALVLTPELNRPLIKEERIGDEVREDARAQ